MAGHFSAIGLSLEDAGSLERFVEEAIPRATEVGRTASGSHLQWTDGSGACVLFHLGKHGSLECVTPFFLPAEGLTRWRVHTTGATKDPDCRHCSGADCDVLDAGGELVTRAAVQWAMFAPYQAWLKKDRTFDLEVVAFAQQAGFFATSADFEAAQADWWGGAEGPEGKPLRFAEVSFLPQGLFGTESKGLGERAVALLAGQVESATSRCSESGQTFHHVRVRSLPGLVDVVVEPAAMTGTPAPGSIAWIEAWLVGRPVEPPPAPGPSLWSRLTRRS